MKKAEQENADFEPPVIGTLIDVRLKARLQDESLSASFAPHPDDDVISAFVEGRLDDAECVSIISHLVGCATCLHLTADLIRFEPDMNEVSSTSISEPDPGPMRQFLDRIAEGVIPSTEDAVFAYQEKDGLTVDDEPEADPDPQIES
jgi:hypothetical protein